MRSTNKTLCQNGISRTILVVLFTTLLACVFALANLGYKPANAETVTETPYNNGSTTDFTDTWGQSNMSAIVKENGNTEVEIGLKDGAGYGYRMVNNYNQELSSSSFEANVFVPKKAVGFVAYTTGAGGYIEVQPALTFAFLQGLKADSSIDETKTTLVIGRDHTSGTMVLDTDGNVAETQEQADADLISEIEMNYDGTGTFYISVEISKLEDGSFTISVDLTDNSIDDATVIPVTAEKMQACVGDTNAVNLLVGGWQAEADGEKNDFVVDFKNYSDKLRADYLVAQASVLESSVASIETITTSVASLTESSTVAEKSSVRMLAVKLKIDTTTNANLRNYEKYSIATECDKLLAEIDALSTGDVKSLVEIASNVDYFKVLTENDAIKTKEDSVKAETAKMSVDYDALLDLQLDEVSGADDTMTKYETAKGILDNEKDAFVLADIVNYETAVKDLSNDEKIVAAAELKATVVLTNCKLANKKAYEERMVAANAKLSSAMVSYAGDLADNWDIYNVTFIKENNGEIMYSGSDYYNDDEQSDMGISFKDKFKLDGFSVEFTVNQTSTKDTWIGFHFFSDLSVMRISNKGDIPSSTGITTLIVPGTDQTQFQMGYPKLYGNTPVGGWPKHDFATQGTKMKIEFAKEGDVYKAYVTANDGEKLLIREMDAAMLETALPNGEGYFNFGSCDKWGEGFDITIHKINGVSAASSDLGQIVTEPDDSSTDSETTSTPTSESVSEAKGGCGSAIGGELFIILALAFGVVLYTAKRRVRN